MNTQWPLVGGRVKFIYSEKATKFCEIFPLLLTVCTVVKSKGKNSQNFVAFSEEYFEEFISNVKNSVNTLVEQLVVINY